MSSPIYSIPAFLLFSVIYSSNSPSSGSWDSLKMEECLMFSTNSAKQSFSYSGNMLENRNSDKLGLVGLPYGIVCSSYV